MRITFAERVFAFLQDLAGSAEVRLVRNFERRTERIRRYEDTVIRLRRWWLSK